MNKKTIFWDVDTQFDFIMPKGKLYIPSAEQIIDNINTARKFALENGFSIIASIDWHSLNDPEISENPDFKKTFPPHCLAGQPGAERIGFLGDLQIEYIPFEPLEEHQLKKLIDKPQFHIVLKTNSTDVFENPNTAKLIKLLNPQRVIVFGVATDVCVYNAVIGLAR